MSIWGDGGTGCDSTDWMHTLLDVQRGHSGAIRADNKR